MKIRFISGVSAFLFYVLLFICCEKRPIQDPILQSIKNHANLTSITSAEQIDSSIIIIDSVINSFRSSYSNEEINQYKNLFWARAEFDKIYFHGVYKEKQDYLQVIELFLKKFNPDYCSPELKAECYKEMYNMCLALGLKEDANRFKARMFESYPKIEEFTPSAYKHLGVYYYKHQDYQGSAIQYKQEYEFNLNKNKVSNEILGQMCNNIGFCYEKILKYDSSIIYFEKAKEHWKKHTYKTDIEKGFWLKFADSNKATALMHMNKSKEAIPFLKEEIEYIKKNKLTQYEDAIPISTVRLAACYSRENKPIKALELLKSIKNPNSVGNYYDELRMVAAKLGKEDIIEHCDSMINLKNEKKRITKVNIDKNTDRLKNIVNQTNLLLEKEESDITNIVMGIGILFFLSSLLLIRIRNKKNKNSSQTDQSKQIVLSGREQEIIPLIIKGKTNKEIGLELGISENTVKYHLKKLYTKCNVTSRKNLVEMFSNHNFS